MTTRLAEHYESTVKPKLKEHFDYTNDLAIPRLDKIVLNMGLGEAATDSKKVDTATNEMARIAGQAPVVTRAKTSVANFKLREGMPIGCKVTLRRERMFEFLDRLVITIALAARSRFPRPLRTSQLRRPWQLRHAASGSRSCSPRSTMTANRRQVRGMDVIICTTANTDDEARELLRAFEFPFRD